MAHSCQSGPLSPKAAHSSITVPFYDRVHGGPTGFCPERVAIVVGANGRADPALDDYRAVRIQSFPLGCPIKQKGNTMNQQEINKTEWANQNNWGGPKWMSAYFSKKDNRVWVPKQIPWMGFTLNFAHTGGVLWLIFTIIFVVVLPIIIMSIAK